MNNIWQMGKNNLEITVEPLKVVKSSLADSIQVALEASWEKWITEHPTIGFFFSHPWLSTIFLIILVLTIWGLIQKIPTLFVDFLGSIFKSPFILGKSLLQNKEQNEEELSNGDLTPDLSYLVTHDKNLDKILAKLEQITQQQISIQKEQKNILARLKQLEKSS